MTQKLAEPTAEEAPLALPQDAARAEIGLSRDTFFAELIGHLAGTVEASIGPENAEAFIGHVGRDIGARIGATYAREMGGPPQDVEGLAAVLVDLKARIGGDFKVVEMTPERIVLINSACPFAENVKGRESLCQMTKNVFTQIARDVSGTARVTIPEAIARGDPGCRVVVHLGPAAVRQADATTTP